MTDRRVLWFVLAGAAAWALVMTLEATEFATDRCPGGPSPAAIACLSTGTIAGIELADTTATFHAQLAQQNASRYEVWNADVARVNTAMDFVLIALYWSAFVLLARHAGGRWATAAAIAISVAAAADVVENVRLLQALTAVLTHVPVGALPRPASVVKWEALAATEFLLAAALPRRRTSERMLIGLLVISAIASAIGPFALGAVTVGAGGLFGALVAASWTTFPFARLTVARVLVLIEAAYLLRFPIIAAVVLAAGIPAGRFFAPSLAAGVFDAIAFPSLVFIVWAACTLAWTVMITSRIVLLYGGDRFEALQGFCPSDDPSPAIIALFGALAAPSVSLTWCGTAVAPAAKTAAVVVGVLLAIGILWFTSWVHYRVDPARVTTVVLPRFGLPVGNAPAGAPRPAALRTIDHAISRLVAPTLGVGIRRSADDARPGNLRSGHLLAATILLILLVVYALLGVLFSPSVLPSARPAALFYVLFLLILFTWGFAGLAFFLDALRLPVLSTAIALSLLSGIWFTDHQFAISQAAVQPVPSASDVVTAWERTRARGNPDAPIVIVATAGGGIRAAAWTTRVVTGLAETCPSFASSLVLVSSVSGGSVGSMYIVGSYEHGDGLASAALPSINRSAGESALAAAGWGLAYPDFIRSLPLGGVVGHLVGALLRRQFDTVDRGLALEAEWIDNWEAPPWKSAPTLREWVADAAAGTRPAAIFNATASESGQRFVIGTTTLARHPEVDGADTFTVQFAKSFAGFDLPIATAVRLSASFPWVSPMSRPQSGPEPLRVHVGDGAYYDNSGVVSATEWLLDARSALGRHPVTVLLIDAASDVPEPGTGWSWQRQLVAPLETLLSVRTSSQQFRAAYEQDVVAELLRDEERDVRAVFLAYPADRLAPLSWHLTADQRQRIERAWSDPDPTLRAATDTIRMRLGCAAR